MLAMRPPYQSEGGPVNPPLKSFPQRALPISLLAAKLVRSQRGISVRDTGLTEMASNVPEISCSDESCFYGRLATKMLEHAAWHGR